jgi:hypothetical protein
MRRHEGAGWFSGISTSSPYGRFAVLSIALWVAVGSGMCFAAERQREFDNSDIERVMRENPGFATKPAPPRAATVYLCKQATGRPVWTDTPCSRSDASTIDIFAVPAGLTFDERIQHAQDQRRQKTPAPRQSASSPRSELTLQQKHDECLKLKADLSALWRRRHTTETYLAQSRPIKARQNQIGCD